MILVDTNVLVYAINTDAPQHEACWALVEEVRSGKVKGVLVPQILLEFFAVVTSSRRIAKPLEPGIAWEQVEALRAIFPVLDAGTKALDLLKTEINSERKVKGADSFDAFLVTQLRTCGASVLCTYNTKDFTGYKGIVVRTPEEILNSHYREG